jgi:hypothetical protein
MWPTRRTLRHELTSVFRTEATRAPPGILISTGAHSGQIYADARLFFPIGAVEGVSTERDASLSRTKKGAHPHVGQGLKGGWLPGVLPLTRPPPTPAGGTAGPPPPATRPGPRTLRQPHRVAVDHVWPPEQHRLHGKDLLQGVLEPHERHHSPTLDADHPGPAAPPRPRRHLRPPGHPRRPGPGGPSRHVQPVSVIPDLERSGHSQAMIPPPRERQRIGRESSCILDTIQQLAARGRPNPARWAIPVMFDRTAVRLDVTPGRPRRGRIRVTHRRSW